MNINIANSSVCRERCCSFEALAGNTDRQPRTLCFLAADEKAVITGVDAVGSERRRLRELGLTDGEIVRCVIHRRHGMCAFLIKGMVIALREGDADRVMIHPIIEREGGAL